MSRQVLLAQRGQSLLKVAAAGMGSSVQPMAATHITDTTMLLYPMWRTRLRLDNTSESFLGHSGLHQRWKQIQEKLLGMA